jgi:hypothetical protein
MRILAALLLVAPCARRMAQARDPRSAPRAAGTEADLPGRKPGDVAETTRSQAEGTEARPQPARRQRSRTAPPLTVTWQRPTSCASSSRSTCMRRRSRAVSAARRAAALDPRHPPARARDRGFRRLLSRPRWSWSSRASAREHVTITVTPGRARRWTRSTSPFKGDLAGEGDGTRAAPPRAARGFRDEKGQAFRSADWDVAKTRSRKRSPSATTPAGDLSTSRGEVGRRVRQGAPQAHARQRSPFTIGESRSRRHQVSGGGVARASST